MDKATQLHTLTKVTSRLLRHLLGLNGVWFVTYDGNYFEENNT